MIKIAIEVSGGVVQNVSASDPNVEIMLFDYDDMEAEGDIVEPHAETYPHTPLIHRPSPEVGEESESAVATQAIDEPPVELVDRETQSIRCSCGGFAERVKVTPAEEARSGCGRPGCCSRAFLCGLCKRRICRKAEAPEMG